MILRLINAPHLSARGLFDDPLVINTRTGKILPSHTIVMHKPINLSGYMLFPGLINAHDHLELNHFPRTKFRESYSNAHQWGEDVSTHLDESPFRELQSYSLRDRCLSGGIKNLLSGVTTVAHHNPLHRPLKSRHFPVTVVQNYEWAHSLHFASPATIIQNHRKSKAVPFMIHLAEGTDDIAAAECRQLDQLGALSSHTVLIHGVGLSPNDTRYAIQHGASLIWCPSTNHYLLGQTADVHLWAGSGKLALGSDSRLTADGDLLDELCAAAATHQLDSQTLFALVTTNPARILNLPDIGDIIPDYQADLIAIPYADDPYQALIHAKRADIALVIRGGKVMFGNPDVVEQFSRGKFDRIRFDGVEKLMARAIVKQIRRSKIPENGLEIL
jgi:cytosine/adenosine deaminase-related metal-dependent hydrolase